MRKFRIMEKIKRIKEKVKEHINYFNAYMAFTFVISTVALIVAVPMALLKVLCYLKYLKKN